MPGERIKASKFMQRCVADVVAGGKDTDAAFGICTAQSQKAGYTEPGTRTLTGKGRRREKQFANKRDMAGKRAAYKAATGRAEEAEKSEAARKLENALRARDMDMPGWLRKATVVSAQEGKTSRSDPNFALGSVSRVKATVRDDKGELHKVEVEIWGNADSAGVEVMSDRVVREDRSVRELLRRLEEGAVEGDGPDAKEVAAEILRQLGGRRFLAMTGAKDLMSTKAIDADYPFPGLGFKLPIGKYKAIRIGLNPATDTYVVQFLSRSMRVAHEMPDVYADNLQYVIGQQTGLALSL